MSTWVDRKTGIVHALSHENEEKRAGRTWCGGYIEFWYDELCDETVPVSCLLCLAEPVHTPEQWREAVQFVSERGDDAITWCGAKHLERRTGNGACVYCGYKRQARMF